MNTLNMKQGNVITSPETLTELAKSTKLEVRKAVAENPSTPPETLTQLAKDEEWLIRNAVISNPSTPSQTIAKLGQSSLSPWWFEYDIKKALQKKVEQDGICEKGTQLPVEWLISIYAA